MYPVAPPPTLPADARRAEPPPSPLLRSREGDGAQLGTLLTATQRLEQSTQASATSLQELRSELTTVRGQLAQASSAASLQELRAELQSLRGQLTQANVVSLQELQSLRGQLSAQTGKDTTMPTPRFSPPGSRMATVAAVIAAITALGALAGAALVIVEQKQQLTSLAEVAATTHSISQTVTQLGETVAALGENPKAAAKPGPPAGPRPSDPAEGKTPVCAPAAEGAAGGKARVLLPNLVGLRLAEARTTVAPLQLQLLPTDKKLKETSKIGWQLPNPGAELESDEAVTVSLKPPKQTKKKKG